MIKISVQVCLIIKLNLADTLYAVLFINTVINTLFLTEAIWVQVGLVTWASIQTALVEQLVTLTDGCLDRTTSTRLPHHGLVTSKTTQTHQQQSHLVFLYLEM